MNVLRRIQPTLPHVLLFVTLFGLLALAELAPGRFERLMQEDGWAEWSTFTTFLLACAVAFRALWQLRRERSRDVLRWLALLGLGLFCLFVAGEEISWGQRVLGFRPAALFLENNHQQESNLHNLLKDVLETRWMVFLVCLAYGVLAPYAARVARFPSVLAAPIALLPWFTAVAWLSFSYPYELVGELSELMLGLLFLTDLLERRAAQMRGDEALSAAADSVQTHPPAGETPGGRIVIAQLCALVVAGLCLPLNEVSLLADNAELVAHTERDLSTLAARMESGDALRSSLFRKREVHKRLYTAVKAGYLDLERERFYLDAWNSPYWISFVRDAGEGSQAKGRVLLYSFGPNRRRDLDPKLGGAQKSGGDDVELSIEVSAPARAER